VVTLVVHASPPMTAFLDAGVCETVIVFCCWILLCFFFFFFFSDSLLCACINLVIGFRPECVTDSLFK
jgi:hypothetical protein